MDNDTKQKIVDYYTNCDYLWQELEGEIRKRYLKSLFPLLVSISEKIPNRLAIDVGCGGGAYTQLLPKLFKKTMGCDITRRLVDEGRRIFPEIQFECADAAHLPVADSSADFVMSVGLTEHLDTVEIEKYFEEMARVLSPEGACIFRVWGKYTIAGLLAKLGHSVDGMNLNLCFYGRREIRKQLQSTGFNKIRFVGALFLARWWGSNRILGKLLWVKPVRKLILFLEQHSRWLPIYETYWVIASKASAGEASKQS
jgi:SAM-dependent methyltransferase